MVAVRAPTTIEKTRLILRKPVTSDAEAVFAAYATDASVTRHLGWPRHRTIDDTRDFLAFSTAEWARWPAGPYLVCARVDGRVLGGSGFAFETPQRASTGYVLARDAWGRGYATETLRAIVTTAVDLGVQRLYALCHPEHRALARVLEKCDFQLEGRSVVTPSFRTWRSASRATSSVMRRFSRGVLLSSRIGGDHDNWPTDT